MIPINSDFINWLDDDGELRTDAPPKIKKEYAAFKKHYDKWQKERFDPTMDEDKLKEYEDHFKSNIESQFELDMIMELITELRKKSE